MQITNQEILRIEKQIAKEMNIDIEGEKLDNIVLNYKFRNFDFQDFGKTKRLWLIQDLEWEDYTSVVFSGMRSRVLIAEDIITVLRNALKKDVNYLKRVNYVNYVPSDITDIIDYITNLHELAGILSFKEGLPQETPVTRSKEGVPQRTLALVDEKEKVGTITYTLPHIEDRCVPEPEGSYDYRYKKGQVSLVIYISSLNSKLQYESVKKDLQLAFNKKFRKKRLKS